MIELYEHINGNIDDIIFLDNIIINGNINDVIKSNRSVLFIKKMYDLLKYNLGNLYFYGHGTEINLELSKKYYILAFEAGYIGAATCIGICSQTLNNKFEETIKWFTIAYSHNKNDELGIHPTNLAECFLFKKEMFKIEPTDAELKLAFSILEKVENCEWGDGINYLGYCYYHGKGVEQNKDRGIELFEKASDNNCFDACYNLCYHYYQNNNNEKVIEYYKKANEIHDLENFQKNVQGRIHTTFQNNSHIFSYIADILCEQGNIIKAQEMYKKAIQNGHLDSISKLEKIESNITFTI